MYLDTLTKIEKEIAEYTAWGFSKKEIANKVCRSVHTINNHLRNIYLKLEIKKETDLVRYFFIDEYNIPVNPKQNPAMKVIAVFVFGLTFAFSLLSSDDFVRIRTVRIRTNRTRKELII